MEIEYKKKLKITNETNTRVTTKGDSTNFVTHFPIIAGTFEYEARILRHFAGWVNLFEKGFVTVLLAFMSAYFWWVK